MHSTTYKQNCPKVRWCRAFISFHSLSRFHPWLFCGSMFYPTFERDAIEFVPHLCRVPHLCTLVNVFAFGQQKPKQPKIHVFYVQTTKKVSNPRSMCFAFASRQPKWKATQVSKTPHWFRVLSHVGGGKKKLRVSNSSLPKHLPLV
jgi:hypothetical protein